MKRKTIKITRYIIAALAAALIGLVIANAVVTDAQTEEGIRQTDAFIEMHEITSSYNKNYNEPETVSLSYLEWREGNNDTDYQPADSTTYSTDGNSNFYDPSLFQTVKDQDIYLMDVWTLGSYLYGISEIDTTRSLILISYEGYGPDSLLSYYVAAACWTRATNDYLGYADNMFTSFGGLDPQYGLWMDELGWETYAENVLRECYLNPVYITGCNGVEIPESWIYEENGIYVW